MENPKSPLVPRMKEQGYTPQHLAHRRAWLEDQTGSRLSHIGACTIPGEEMRGNTGLWRKSLS